ncbi:(2,3-dihydroxybenzoyl)adenylate synthase [Terrihabitans rhizophilus]|uniref:(2,3-dihydroxybenzoyl)adenylate synthase n=1 Tax=Terrihabitans rhizophilus TaxID=3092662 RepID=A0ABU4RLV4_9HYPH|nr:(2,3-dihydroxybenzoyl)adenylate synthase [Terrihabitans sp. PJ23]MDX6805089.1 (2,3-dihydroxybenzoyl)adenylate synthase [Terrihabitans sp. PJ23]
MIPLQQTWPPEFAARYRAAGYWRGETFGGFLRQRAAEAPDRLAVVGGEHRWTYAELDRRADAVAAGFLELGLVPGERVVVHLSNIAEFFSTVFGLFRAGLVPVYALPAHRITEIAHFARGAEASAYVIADRHDGFDYRALARQLQTDVPAVREVVVVGDAGEFTPFAQLEGASGSLLPEPSPSEVAFLQISGGSTGLSKLIPRTHDDYIFSFRASAEICGQDASSVYLTALPVAHNFPMSSPGVFGTLYTGGCVVLSPSPAPDVAFPLIARERVTITGLVPPLALLWLQASAANTHDLSSLQVLQVGGAKLTPEVAKRVGPALGCTLQQVFGMAEGLVNYTRLDDPEDVIVNTQGRPISVDDEVIIVDDAGQPVPEGEAGYLLTRGPYTIRAYHNDPAANARAFTEDGFYRTGDVVKRTPEGNLVVQGRATDHINRAGEKISAEEIEDHLLAHPAVFDAAVVSIPDAVMGERSCAFIIPQGEKPKGAVLKAWIRERGLAEFKVPDQVVFVDGFMETAVGKISRKELRAALRARHLAAKETA